MIHRELKPKRLIQYFSVTDELIGIPLQAVWAMDGGQDIAINCLYQAVAILNYISYTNNVFFYELNLDAIFFRAFTPFNQQYFLIAEEFQVEIPLNIYNVCFDWKKIQPRRNSSDQVFRFNSTRFDSSVFMQLFDHPLLGFTDHLSDDHPLIKLRNNLRNSSKFSGIISLDIFETPGYEEWVPILLSLITHPIQQYNDCTNDMMVIRDLQARIIRQYNLVKSQFRDQKNCKIILDNWHTILRNHDREFWTIVNTGDSKMLVNLTGRLRNYLYQLLVEHQYSHIRLNDLNFKELIVSCFFWAKECQSWLASHTRLYKQDHKADEIFIMIMNLFVAKDDPHRNRNNKLQIFTENKLYSKTIQDVWGVHPALRAKWIADYVRKTE